MQIPFLPRYGTPASSVSITLYFSFLHFEQPVDVITSQFRLLFSGVHEATLLSLLGKTWGIGRVNPHDGGCRETVSMVLNNRKVYR